MPSDVFHVRLNALELQAERIMDPSLKTRPVAIISSPHPNGTIVSLSPEAEDEGLFHGMKVSVVRKMNRGIQLLPYNRSLYARISRYVYQTVSMFTPIVEPEGFDGFYLDMKGMQTIYRSANPGTNQSCGDGGHQREQTREPYRHIRRPRCDP